MSKRYVPHHYDSGNSYLSSRTRIITKHGISELNELKDNDKIEVIDKDGNWREATVHVSNHPITYYFVFDSGYIRRFVVGTGNQKWLLEDGTFTDNIKIGDRLANANAVNSAYVFDDESFVYGFVLGYEENLSDGRSYGKVVEDGYKMVCLCGENTKYLSSFIRSGWVVKHKHPNNDITVMKFDMHDDEETHYNLSKWYSSEYDKVCSMFNGYIASSKNLGVIDNDDNFVLPVWNWKVTEALRTTSCVAGYYLLDESNEPSYINSDINMLHFAKQQVECWQLVGMDNYYGDAPAYYIEEPVTHTFTLEGGLVIGDCVNISLVE